LIFISICLFGGFIKIIVKIMGWGWGIVRGIQILRFGGKRGRGSQLWLNFNSITKFIMKNGVINESRGKLNSSKSFFIGGWGEKIFKSFNLS
jgi:hypothetical protein